MSKSNCSLPLNFAKAWISVQSRQDERRNLGRRVGFGTWKIAASSRSACLWRNCKNESSYMKRSCTVCQQWTFVWLRFANYSKQTLSVISSFYGLFYKALRVIKPRRSSVIWGILPHRLFVFQSHTGVIRRTTIRALNSAPFETLSVFLQKRKDNTNNKYTLSYERTIYTSTIKSKWTGTT